MMKRTRWAAVVTLTAVAVGLTACASGTAADNDRPVQLYGFPNPWLDAIRDELPDFTAETGIEVEITELTEAQIEDQLQIKLNSQSDDVDVMMIGPGRQGPEFVANGWIRDLTEQVESDPSWDWEDFAPEARELVTIEDGIYSIPVAVDYYILYYRKDLLEQAGLEVPQTMDELVAAADQLNDPDAGVYGFVARGIRGPATHPFSGFFYSYTGTDFFEDGKSMIGTPEAIDAYETYGYLLREDGPPGATDMNWTESIPIFQTGGSAFTVEGTQVLSLFLLADESKVKDSVGFATLPAGPGGQRPALNVGVGLSISEYSSNAENAWEFIKWAQSKENVTRNIENLIASPRTSVWSTPEAQEAYPAELIDLILNPPATAEYVGHNTPVMRSGQEARDIVSDPIIAAINGDDVPAAAEQADKAFQDLLTRLGY